MDVRVEQVSCRCLGFYNLKRAQGDIFNGERSVVVGCGVRAPSWCGEGGDAVFGALKAQVVLGSALGRCIFLLKDEASTTRFVFKGCLLYTSDAADE